MKVMFILLAYFSYASVCLAQDPSTYPSVIEVGKNTTTMLVFPSRIKDADRGSADIIIQPVKNARHVLKVKAIKGDFLPTNLTIFTLDDKIYSVTVVYAAEPDELAYNFTNTPLNSPPSIIRGLNDTEIEQNAAIIAGLSPSRKRPAQNAFSMKCNLTGIYVKDGILFFQFYLKNNSNIPYTLDFLRCYHRDKIQSKRSSQMEKEITPRFFKQQTILEAYSSNTFVAAFDQFTIADNKLFIMECFEKNGDRHLSLKIRGKHILRAKILR